MNAPTAWSEFCRTLSPSLVAACCASPVAAGPAALTREIAQHIPKYPFREILCRGGWYRLGGIVDAQGRRISDNLEEWVDGELAARDNDLALLQEDFAESGLQATRLSGRTHFLVAPTGPGSTDFLQLEIEELQETGAHRLFDRQTPAGTIDELVDTRAASEGSPPIGAPFYRFRRLSHIGDTLNRMCGQAIDAQPIHRFVADWEASSAARASALCNHWVIALREHLDRYRNTVIRAQPVAALNGAPPVFSARQGTSGPALGETLGAFNRQVGYPMAWFFHLVTTRAVPHWVAISVAEDAQAGFSYLPERDLAIVRGWLHKSYAF